MIKKRIPAYAILLMYIIIVLLFHLFGYTGHFGFDDLHYAGLANDLLNGTVNFEDHYAYRFPLILFTSLFYSIFGISDFTSALPSLIITIAILITVYNNLREQGTMAIIIGLSLTTLSNWFLFYSDKMMPDIYVALSVIWALSIIARYRFKSGRTRTLPYALLLALSLLFGFMAKGTIVLVIPLLLFLVVTDIIQKRDMRFWIYSVISGLALLALYLLVIWIVTGDVMKRFDAIASNSYLNLCSYDQQSIRILLRRIFFSFFELTVYQSLATGFIFIIASLFQKNAGRYFKLDDAFSFYLVSALILLLSSNFMTISLSSYAPMCLDPRHYLFLVPVASIPASKIIVDFMKTKRSAIPILIALLSVTVVSFFLQGHTFWKLYLPLFALFSTYYLARTMLRNQQLFVILFAGILMVIPLEMIKYAQKVNYREQRAVAVEQVLDSNRDCFVITNEVQKRLLGYYSSFDNDQSRRFLSYDEFEADTTTGGKKLLFLNGHTRYLSGMEQTDLPYYARNISPANPTIYESIELDLHIYELRALTLPGHSETPLISTLNDFESTAPFWHQNEQDLSTHIKYAGAKSNMVSEYSATFEYPLDSLPGSAESDLLIHSSLLCYAVDKTSAKIIVSLENSEGTGFWKAFDINRFLKAYSNWWPVTLDVTIKQKELKSASRLKIYVWNSEEQEIYIDNFQISLSGLTPLE